MIALSNTLAGLIYQKNHRIISESRDFRQFILEELQRAYYIDTEIAGEVNLQPPGIICEHVETPEVIEAWKDLLGGCVDRVVSAQFDPQIATWETDALREHSGAMVLTIHHSEAESGPQVYHLPLVWDDDSWATQLATQEWWPDLHRCVELHFRTHPAMRDFPGVREQPIPFEDTRAFQKSVDQYGKDEQLRRSLVEALTKRVYGILDASLGDEPLGRVRRFRVTRFWRVHYREEEGRIILEEFGPHSIGGVD
jgi:hypothetical protein